MDANLEVYHFLWKEKKKFEECGNCPYNAYCLGFYKNWLKFTGEAYAKEKVMEFLKGKATGK